MIHRFASLVRLIAACAVFAAFPLGSQLGASPVSAAAQRAGIRTAHAPALTPSQIRASYAHFPLAFEPNRGQAAAGVQFLAHGPGYALFLTGSDAVLVLHSASAQPRTSGTSYPPVKPNVSRGSSFSPSAQTAVRLHFLGANTHPQVIGLNHLVTRVSYFIGNKPAGWHTNIPTYDRVEVRNVYHGIDLIYDGHSGHLTYGLVVHPHANLGAVRFKLEGTKGAHLDAAGNLILGTGASALSLMRPAFSQRTSRNHGVVYGRYELGAQGAVGIRAESASASAPLYSYPVLDYSTYLGGTTDDEAYGIAVDGAGEAYVTGDTASTDFPTCPGATRAAGNDPCVSASGVPLQSVNHNQQDAYDAVVSKLNSAGTQLVYSTYLGGSNSDFGNGVAVDGSGAAYVTGFTGSTDFPICPGGSQPTGNDACQSASGAPLQASNTCRCDIAFVAKLSPSGTRLVYSTYLGGTNAGDGNGIAVDATGDAYVAGFTYAADFPTCPGSNRAAGADPCALATGAPLQTANHGSSQEAFVVKLNPTGTQLVYSTYLGGSGDDQALAVAIDDSGAGYVTGYGNSADFPTCPGSSRPAGSDPCVSPTGTPLQAVNHGGSEEAFVTKLSPAGTQLVYSTYLGGSADDYGWALAVDAAHFAYVTGYTQSTDFPICPGTSRPAGSDQCTSASGTPLQTTNHGDYQAFVSKLNPAGTQLAYGTYFGGSGDDGGFGIGLDGAGNVHVVDITTSSDLPTCPGSSRPAGDDPCTSTSGVPMQTTNHGVSDPDDGAVLELDPSGSRLVYSTYLGGSDLDAPYALATDAAGDTYVAGFTGSTDYPTCPGSNRPAGDDQCASPDGTPLQSTNRDMLYSAFVSKLAPGLAHPGTVAGGTSCSTTNTSLPTCGPSPSSGTRLTIKINASCSGPSTPTCSGGGDALIGSTAASIQFTSGSLYAAGGGCTASGCPTGGSTSLHGQGSYGGQPASFSFQGNDDDASGIDNFELTITPNSGATQTYHWTCNQCLEIAAQPTAQGY